MEQRSRRDVRAHDEARRRQGEAAVSGARWLTAAQVFNQGLRSAMNLVLVWFLTTGDYGQVGVALDLVETVQRRFGIERRWAGEHEVEVKLFRRMGEA